MRNETNVCETARIADDLHAGSMELQESNISQNDFDIVDLIFAMTDLQDVLKLQRNVKQIRLEVH